MNAIEKNYHMTQQSHYWAHSHNWKHNWKRNMYPNIHCKTIYSSQDKEPRYSLIDEWIKKIWYIYAMEYFSAIKRNEIHSVKVMQINIEHVIQNEVGQKEKNEYCILRHIYIYIYIYRERERERERRQWHPTPVLLPGKSHGQRSLVGCSPWGCKRVGYDLVSK